jgi:SET domain
MSRKRHWNDQGWWQQAVEWVEGNGGKVHPNVTLSDDRQLYLEKTHDKGTELLRIPFACLVCKTNIETTSHGQQLMQAIQKVDGGKLYSPLHDLLLALTLAGVSETEPQEDTVFRPYLNTLPEESSFEGLPRFWPDDDLKYLQGSPLLERVQSQKRGIESDHRRVRDEWKKLGKSDESFPSLEAFNYRLAAVSSRAFAGFGSIADKNEDDMNIAMVPLLDLCNHCRGKSETKNLSYCQAGSMIVVTASQPITAGESLRITYGARSNAQLLLNYGFCIPDNNEPDGSSNDFLEFSPPGNSDKSVNLQAGPKAHSFHGFVNALDSFTVLPKERSRGVDKDEIDDFDANEEQFAQWDMDMTKDMMGSMGEEDEDEEDEDEEAMEKHDKQAIENYLGALISLESRLHELQAAYYLEGKELQEALGISATVNKRHAALLVLSEHRTIYFVLCVIRQLRCLLGPPGNNAIKDDGSVKAQVTEADMKLLRGQAQEIVSAFMAIRLSGVTKAYPS